MNINIAFIVSLLITSSCVPSSSMNGSDLQKSLLGYVGKTEKYESNVSLIYSNKEKKFTLSGCGIITSMLKRSLEPRSIYNNFKCYFIWDGKVWRAKRADDANVVSTLNTGELSISKDGQSARVVNFEYAPFYGTVPSVDLSKSIPIDYQE